MDIIKKINSSTDSKFTLFLFSLMIAIIFFFLFVSFTFFDSDGYFILSTGREILNKGISVFDENPFFVLDGYDITIQQWPWCIAVYSIYSLFGQVGLNVLTSVTLFADVAMIFKIGKIKSVAKEYSILFSIVFTVIMAPFINIRPTLVSILIFLIEIYFLEKYNKEAKTKCLWSLVLLSVIMVNLHAAMWPLLFVFIIPYIFPAIHTPLSPIEKSETSWKPLFYVLPCALLVGLLNPDGIEGALYLFYSYSPLLKELGISELSSPTLFSYFGIQLVIVSLFLYFKMQQRFHSKVINEQARTDSANFYLFCGTLIMAIMHLKNISFVALGTVILLSDLYKNKPFKMKKNISEKQITISSILVLLSIPVFAFEIGSFVDANNQTESYFAPVSALETLEERNVSKDTPIYTDFNTGAYLEWQGYSNIYMDARPEIMFDNITKKANVTKEYQEAKSNQDKFDNLADTYEFEYYIVTKGTNEERYLQENENARLIDSTDYNCLFHYELDK